MTKPRPIAMLIAALGGEGGGVLTDWIVSAAAAQGYPVQSTSIPGVAQRTGATTYYIEILPVTFAALRGKRRVLSGGSGGSARCWDLRRAAATATSWWRASSWRPAARSGTALSRPTAPR